MRENRCVFYKSPPLEIGQKIPNVKLYRLNGIDTTTLYDVLSDNGTTNHTSIIAAFSMS